MNSAIYKNVKGYIDYKKFNNDYPQNIIFIAGFAKSGSTWISNMFAELEGFDQYVLTRWQTRYAISWDDFITTDLYPGCFQEFDKRLAVIKGHTKGKKKNRKILQDLNMKYFVTVRDPRDKLISSYYYIKNNSAHWDFKKSKKLSLGEFISYKLKSGEYEEQVIEWLRSWKNISDRNLMILKYEDALNITTEFLMKSFNHLEINIPYEKAEQIAIKHSFQNLTGRQRGEEDLSAFKRKGISGEWKEIFTEEHRNLFSEIGEDVIEWRT